MRNVVSLLLVAAACGMVHAGPDDNWIVQLRASDPTGAYAMSFASFGTMAPPPPPLLPPAPLRLPTNPGNKAEVYCYDLGGNPPRWYYEIRSPVEEGTSKTWHLILTAGSTYASSRIKLAGWNQSGPDHDLNGSIPVTLIVVNDPSWPDGPGSCAPNTPLWVFDGQAHGTSSSPTLSATAATT